MRGSPRPLRVADRIQMELAEILQRRLKDPRAGFITVTGVDVPSDLRTAKVYVSTLNDEDLADAIGLLEHARGFLRSELGRRLNLRFAPELIFRPDRSAARGRHIEDLLRRIREEGTAGESDDADAPGVPADDLDEGPEDEFGDEFDDEFEEEPEDEPDDAADDADSPDEDGR